MRTPAPHHRLFRRPSRQKSVFAIVMALFFVPQDDASEKTSCLASCVNPMTRSESAPLFLMNEADPTPSERPWTIKTFTAIACPFTNVCRVADNTVVIEAWRNGEVYGYATGFVAKPRLILTVAHAIREYGEPEKSDLDVYCRGHRRHGRVVAFSGLRDTAVISADCTGEDLAIGESPPVMNTTVWITGFDFILSSDFSVVTRSDLSFRFLTMAIVSGNKPAESSGKEWSIMSPLRARLKAMREQGEDLPYGIDSLVESGNSGSPVCLSDGTIVGMVSIRHPDKSTTFLVPPQYLKSALGSVNWDN